MPSDATSTIQDLRDAAAVFRDARNWERFHNPKDLSLAIMIEAGELGELFLWKSSVELASLTEDARLRAAEEVADVLLYLLYMADALHIDLATTIAGKVAKNARKYPVDRDEH